MKERDPKEARLDPELERIARALDEAAHQEQRDLAVAGALPDPPDRAALEERMDGLWRERDRRRRRLSLLRGLGILASAAALVFVLVLLRSGPSDPGPGDELLGESEVRILVPSEAGSLELIEWRGPHEVYVLRVRAQEDGRILLGPERVAGESLRLAPGASERWPDAIVIEIEWRLPDGSIQQTSRELSLRR